MANTLLNPPTLPAWQDFNAADVTPAIEQLIADNRASLAELTANPAAATWENLIAPLEQREDVLEKAWSPVSHLNGVLNSDPLREAYNACLPLLSSYQTELGQHQGLYQSCRTIAEQSLSDEQRKVIEDILRDFTLSGIALPAEQQQRYGEIKQRLSELTTKFAENVLDATQGWSKQIEDAEQLSGMPEMSLAAAKQAAEARQMQGYLLTLEFPSYLPVMTYCDNRELREEVYTAFSTRASEMGPHAGQWDNSPVMSEILSLRKELAQLLGFDSYAHYSLATKMAETPEQVLGFLEQLASHALPAAKREFAELSEFAAELGHSDLQAWDVTYFAEKLKQQRYQISQEELRPYFPMPKVLEGMFAIAGKLFDIQISEVETPEVWHPDARLFEIHRSEQLIARFYLDPFARANKRGGAWMDTCRTRRRLDDGSLQLPTAYLVCNFNGPVGSDPALLTHDEVTTLFHEFGHGLHHMLTRMEYSQISGINGVAWDAVELPSQFMENWCWQPEALAQISGHYQSGEALPQQMLDKLLAAKNFQSAMMMVRQLEFSLFDFSLHLQYQPGETDIQQLLNGVREQVAVVTPPAFNRFQHGFSHIFAGGYAAGYYSYKWAEVLSADAFSRFEEQGIFNQQAGADFRQHILEMGGSREPMALFVAFRGREPSTDALLRHSGIPV